MEDKIKQEYHEWLSLLRKTDNMDLLRDPYNVWLEAWHVCTLKGEKKTPALDGGKTAN
jgi:hypothetical protein